MSRRNHKKYPNPKLKAGTQVQSRYAARWFGYVKEISDKYDHNVVRCMITHDHNGIPMRKPFLSMWLDTYWLRPLDEKEYK